MKHQPTPPARREEYLHAQAQRLLDEAAAWGYAVVIDGGRAVCKPGACAIADPDAPAGGRCWACNELAPAIRITPLG